MPKNRRFATVPCQRTGMVKKPKALLFWRDLSKLRVDAVSGVPSFLVCLLEILGTRGRNALGAAGNTSLSVCVCVNEGMSEL